jgi:two-component system, sensor histidine kinase
MARNFLFSGIVTDPAQRWLARPASPAQTSAMHDLPPTPAPWDSDDDASRLLLGLIAQSTNDGIWDWDLNSGRVYYSPRWLELVGYLPGELPGDISTFQDCLHEDDRDRVRSGIDNYLSGHSAEYRMEFRLRHQDGTWRWIMSRGIALREADGRAFRLAGTHTDITDRMRAAERLESEVADRTAELRTARDRAESSAAAKTKFLATASHDIRQPLQAMALLLGSLAPEVQTVSGQRTVKAIERSLGASMELLDALLEFIRLDAGAMRAKLANVDLGRLVDSVAESHVAEIARKGLVLKVVPSRTVVCTDPQLLARILRNLISNALKYTEHGSILIGCRRKADKVWLEIWDTGCGIAPEQVKQVFWEFFQGADGRQGGLGLGLAIVERLAGLLKHRIHVRSWQGRGSVFAIEMERSNALPITDEKAPIMMRDVLLTNRRVALIEDDQAVATALVHLLESWGAAVISASTGEFIIEQLGSQAPDLVIADCDLKSDEDGFAVLDRLDRHYGRRLPALVLTGEYDIGALGERNRSNRRVLNKPVWAAVLQAVLHSELTEFATGTEKILVGN